MCLHSGSICNHGNQAQGIQHSLFTNNRLNDGLKFPVLSFVNSFHILWYYVTMVTWFKCLKLLSLTRPVLYFVFCKGRELKPDLHCIMSSIWVWLFSVFRWRPNSPTSSTYWVKYYHMSDVVLNYCFKYVVLWNYIHFCTGSKRFSFCL